MKKLVWFTVLNILSLGLMIFSQLAPNKGFNWIIAVGILLILATVIHFFVEYKKLNKLK